MTEAEKQKDDERDKHFLNMAKRFDEVKGFRSEFNRQFKIEAAKHPMGTVDTEGLSQKILKEMGEADPVKEH